jgi:hypothetical protein
MPDPLHPNSVAAGIRCRQQKRAAAVAQVHVEIAVLIVQESDEGTSYGRARFVRQFSDNCLCVEW